MATSPPPSRRRRWVPFFLLLAVLAAGGVLISLAYNLWQQLSPEQLARARARWQATAPRDYHLTLRVRHGVEPEWDIFQVRVRDGRVVLAGLDDQLLVLAGQLRQAAGVAAGAGVAAIPAHGGERFSINTLFDEMQQDLEADAASGQWNYVVAGFDSRRGFPLRYIRRIRGTHERVEWRVRLEEVPEGK